MYRDREKLFYIVTIGSLMNISSYVGLLNLQSSMNISANVGTASASVLFLGSALVCLFAAPVLLLRLGFKWCLVLGDVGYVAYTLANYHPGFSTLLPAAVFGAFGETLLWTAAPLYINHLVSEQWRNRPVQVSGGRSVDDVRNAWFGTFFAFLKSSQIFGNLIAFGTLIWFRGPENATTTFDNSSALFANVSSCGSNYSLVVESDPSKSQKYIPNQTSSYIVLSIYVALQVGAVLLHWLCLPNVPSDSVGDPGALQILASTLKKTFLHIVSLKHLLLTPISIYYGLLLGYAFANFTRAFVSCAIGVQKVGLVMLIYGITSSGISSVVGRVASNFGLVPIAMAGAIFDCFSWSFQLLWPIDFDNRYLVYVIAAMIGISDATWQITCNSLLVIHFATNKEVAYSVFNLNIIIGLFLGFLLTIFITVRCQLYIMIGTVVVGVIGYLIAEARRLKVLNRSGMYEINPEHINELIDENTTLLKKKYIH